MKKLMKLLSLFSFAILFGQQNPTNYTEQQFLDEGGIICDYIKHENTSMILDNVWFQYKDGEILKIQNGHVDKFAVKYDGFKLEQGLFIKEYLPVNHLSTAPKKIFKFGVDKSGDAIVVIEINYSSTTNYSITKYFTNKWAELTGYK